MPKYRSSMASVVLHQPLHIIAWHVWHTFCLWWCDECGQVSCQGLRLPFLVRRWLISSDFPGISGSLFLKCKVWLLSLQKLLEPKRGLWHCAIGGCNLQFSCHAFQGVISHMQIHPPIPGVQGYLSKCDLFKLESLIPEVTNTFVFSQCSFDNWAGTPSFPSPNCGHPSCSRSASNVLMTSWRPINSPMLRHPSGCRTSQRFVHVLGMPDESCHQRDCNLLFVQKSASVYIFLQVLRCLITGSCGDLALNIMQYYI